MDVTLSWWLSCVLRVVLVTLGDWSTPRAVGIGIGTHSACDVMSYKREGISQCPGEEIHAQALLSSGLVQKPLCW